MESLIGAGFYILRPSARPERASSSLLPPQIISASTCLCPRFPDSYAIEWAVHSEADRDRGFDAVGLRPKDRSSAVAWATENFEKSFGWPGVFYSLEAAKAARAAFFPGSSDLQVVGLGLPSQFVEEFVAYAAPPPSPPGYAPWGESGCLEVVQQRQSLPAGQFLGFELLNVEFGLVTHSWLCNELEAYFAQVLSIQPNEWGLLEDLQSASRCCAALESDEVGAEPGLWLPWGLVRYS